jgi:hypothetical protein
MGFQPANNNNNNNNNNDDDECLPHSTILDLPLSK